MSETTTTRSPQEPYELNHELDGSSFMVRENLADILERELLGPIHGPEEVLPFSPRSQYLVGHIAPVKLTGKALKDGASESAPERGHIVEARMDDDAAREQRGVPAFAADETTADAEDDDTEDRTPKQGLMIPASMGLRFQVPANLASFTVTASWGTYSTVETDQVTKAGRPIRYYQRTPVEEPRTISLADLSPGKTATITLRESICLRVDRYDDPQFGRVLVEIALCNDRETPMPIPVNMWLFQTQLRVNAGGAEVLLPVRDALEQDWPEHDDEVKRLNLQYRNRLEFAIGRTCSVDWVARTGSRRAAEVSTTWLPVAETPQTRARSVKDALLSMDALSTVTPEGLKAGLAPLVSGYGAWLDEQGATAKGLPAHLQETAEAVLWDAAQARQRLADGLEHIASDPEALRCFQFTNRVMRDQRIASQVAALRASDPTVTIEQAQAAVASKGPGAASWRPFQLAFILMQLGALTDPTAAFRSADHLARVELLFFPTGGGKTEAYLGLAAYTFAIRRRQGLVSSTDGQLDGRDGVAVLMRYTLRLLTAQQFQRATTLMCAAELARRENEEMWGAEPFRIGLWVGTDVSPKRFEEADEQLTKANEYGSHRLTVLQIQRCPWCGTPIAAAQVKTDATVRRVFVYCGDDLARCPFSKGGLVDEGLPVLTVDEEIYRLTPAFVIATVDKFARLAREGEAGSLFGYVSRRCGRHGYVHPDYGNCDITTTHPASKYGHPAATVQTVNRLRPPDLIIQDELHLITGALGTAVGLFEAAMETLSSWETPDGKPVRPLIVASTATVRNAQDQVRGLYGRQVEIFPPQVLDVADTYFSQEVPISRENPGRRYLGVSAQGVRLSSAEIRLAEVLLLAGQLLFDRAGSAADPYMTLVGYFNATRELAGMARYIADDVANRVGNPRKDSGFPKRYGAAFGNLHTAELTSRIASAEIGRTLDRLGLEFDSNFDTSTAVQGRIAAIRDNKKAPGRKEAPFDVVLATSMLQVGVDVQRLGLMLVVGQPKNTAEYIQASSRVGRDSSDRPGLVVALGNWARPRDLAHFEQFRNYHNTFYAQVEALSVTPYSPTSLERGIDGLLVSVARVLQAPVADGLSPERSAWRIKEQPEALEALADRLKTRIAAAAQNEDIAKKASDLLVNRIDRWNQRAKRATEMSKTLVYERTGEGDKYLPLIISPENARASVGGSSEAPFVIANSMREVQPEINVLVSPVSERLFSRAPEGAPKWTLPMGEDD
ncbi:DISARM system helicase DrmA [Pseudarthrobacter sp. AL07]|uniref:DISARM system helicase DrmA n=1 Tax=unclassified Pseudarthrobacter TaxID=2647000 RepID=UPI00249C9D94|nr:MULTISPECIES: DISARM system helicase DrmA [unclassified Pseudarthrobacter]MDI3194264.1 DISARM system helicase DrmA [Pseudarthrobacter sp. AL20]MDI3208331.1 DISARM system helicase DrmA [Pseudarthrobacter sp. AL07]